jgi:hypothetical protein
MIVTQIVDLKNTGSKAMKVNGSVTPVEFSYAPDDRTSVDVLGIALALNDDAASDWTKFGGLNGLANGVLIEYAPDGADPVEIMTLKDNADLAVRFTRQSFGPSLISSLGAILGLGGTQCNYFGIVTFRTPLTLHGADKIAATVRDDLRALTNFNMAVVVERGV